MFRYLEDEIDYGFLFQYLCLCIYDSTFIHSLHWAFPIIRKGIRNVNGKRSVPYTIKQKRCADFSYNLIGSFLLVQIGMNKNSPGRFIF